MNHIFDMAEQEFNTKFDLGIKSVRADIMPDHTISLTFSEHPMDQIKDIVNGLLNSIPKKNWDEIDKKQPESETQKVVVLFAFEDADFQRCRCFSRGKPHKQSKTRSTGRSPFTNSHGSCSYRLSFLSLSHGP